MSAIQLKIDGMTCDHCRKTVEDALMSVGGVWGATVDLEHDSAEVQCDPTRVRADDLIEAVKTAGYGAEVVA